MTLLDAPKFDEARDQRNRVMLYGGGGLLFVLIVVFWLAVRPSRRLALELVDAPAGPSHDQPLPGVR